MLLLCQKLTRISAVFLVILTSVYSASAMDIELLKITSSDGHEHIFKVEVARDPADLQKGLMFRETMDDDKGMLFEFSPPQLVSMWMKNTPLSLDMVFIRKNGEIARIAKRTEPFSEQTIPSGSIVTGVLEIRGGRADELNIKAGDKIEHPFFLNK